MVERSQGLTLTFQEDSSFPPAQVPKLRAICEVARTVVNDRTVGGTRVSGVRVEVDTATPQLGIVFLIEGDIAAHQKVLAQLLVGEGVHKGRLRLQTTFQEIDPDTSPSPLPNSLGVYETPLSSDCSPIARTSILTQGLPRIATLQHQTINNIADTTYSDKIIFPKNKTSLPVPEEE